MNKNYPVFHWMVIDLRDKVAQYVTPDAKVGDGVRWFKVYTANWIKTLRALEREHADNVTDCNCRMDGTEPCRLHGA